MSQSISALLAQVGRFLSTLSDSDVAGLISGECRLAIEPTKGKRKRASGKGPDLSPATLEQVWTKLNSLESRTDGARFLAEMLPTKAGLEALAKFADLPVQRRDTLDVLRDRIVESAIGFRLRSRAIQGELGGTAKTKSDVPPLGEPPSLSLESP